MLIFWYRARADATCNGGNSTDNSTMSNSSEPRSIFCDFSTEQLAGKSLDHSYTAPTWYMQYIHIFTVFSCSNLHMVGTCLYSISQASMLAWLAVPCCCPLPGPSSSSMSVWGQQRNCTTRCSRQWCESLWGSLMWILLVSVWELLEWWWYDYCNMYVILGWVTEKTHLVEFHVNAIAKSHLNHVSATFIYSWRLPQATGTSDLSVIWLVLAVVQLSCMRTSSLCFTRTHS